MYDINTPFLTVSGAPKSIFSWRLKPFLQKIIIISSDNVGIFLQNDIGNGNYLI